MARTIRRRWVWDGVPHAPMRLRKDVEATCKPGCETCGKGERKRENRRERHNKRNIIREAMA